MKKLMFAVAAIAAGAAMADVTSANVVGYQNKELSENANSFVAMTLQPIGVAKADVTLSEFVPTDGEFGWSYGTDYLATIKPNGTFDKTFGYVSPFWADLAGDKSYVGWHLFANVSEDNFEGERFDNEKIPFGTGVAVYTAMANVTVTFAGEVLADDYGVPLSENANTFTGIICPADIKLGDLSATDGEFGWSYGTDYLATIKPNGTFDVTYGYVSPFWADLAGDKSYEGWHLFANISEDNFEGERFDNVQLKAGQAIAVYTAMSGVELVVPSALP